MPNLLETWRALQASAVSGQPGGLAMQLIHAGQEVRVFAAVSTPGRSEALLIELPHAHRPKELARITSRRFEAVLADFPGLPRGKCAISVVLKDAEYTDLFAVLGVEVVRALEGSSTVSEASRAVVRSIERWRRFVERPQRGLTDQEVRGLMGELVVLARAASRFGSLSAVASWQGPTGALRDFEFPDFTVEVKTYQPDSGSAVRVNDPHQLEGSPDRKAYLGVVRLSRAQTDGLALPDLIRLVESVMGADVEAVEQFRDRLAAAGYLPSHAAQFTDRYRPSRPLLFAVREGFPRVRPDQVPPGVLDVHFTIQLTALAPFTVDAAGLIGAPSAFEAE
jgi:hypothetical protein